MGSTSARTIAKSPARKENAPDADGIPPLQKGGCIILPWNYRGDVPMYEVIHKETGEVVRVYGINGTYFLLFNQEEQNWYYSEQDNFVPKEE